MVTALVPIAVFAGVTATVFFAFFSIWNQLNERANALALVHAWRLAHTGRQSERQSEAPEATG